jgi:prepilin-type N-terminal cleavage/methylation domain-containing protein
LQRRGFSLIELVTVLTILLALSYFALPAFDIVQVKSREKLLRQRLFDIRRAVDVYVKVRNSSGNPYPPSIASLTDVVPDSLLRIGADPGPFLAAGNLGNPFSGTDDGFIWDIRDTDGVWHKAQANSKINYAAGVYDVRFPEDGVSGWKRAIDETYYKDW